MTRVRATIDAMHGATHRVPGIPAHQKRPKGHQGSTAHGRTHANHRVPRVLVGWQNRIAGLFSRASG